jgi:nucleoside-diphosphate-sugar epimerase
MRYLVTGAAGFIGARFVESCNKDEIDPQYAKRLAL